MSAALDVAALPADVREFWETELASPPPPLGHGRFYSQALADARQRWPERQCGADAVAVTYCQAMALGAP